MAESFRFTKLVRPSTAQAASLKDRLSVLQKPSRTPPRERNLVARRVEARAIKRRSGWVQTAYVGERAGVTK